MAQETQTGALERWNGEGDEKELQKGGDICIPMADSGFPAGAVVMNHPASAGDAGDPGLIPGLGIPLE